MPYQYGQGIQKDLKSLIRWIKKSTENYMKCIDFDFTDLETEIQKIIKYNSKLTKDTILENTTNKELFSLFKEYENKLTEKIKVAGFDQKYTITGKPLFLDSDLRKIIKEMKN